MLRRICIFCTVQIQLRKSCPKIMQIYTASTRQHEVDHTAQESICSERFRSWTAVGIDHTDHTDHLSDVWILEPYNSRKQGLKNNRNARKTRDRYVDHAAGVLHSLDTTRKSQPPPLFPPFPLFLAERAQPWTGGYSRIYREVSGTQTARGICTKTRRTTLEGVEWTRQFFIRRDNLLDYSSQQTTCLFSADRSRGQKG